MKTAFLIVTMGFATQFVSAQSLDRSVVASGGKEMSTATAGMEFTIGEMATSQLSGTGAFGVFYQITQGYNQGYSIGRVSRQATGELEDMKSEELQMETVSFNIFPNPTTDVLNLRSQSPLQEEYTYRMLTASGQEIYSGTVAETENQLDMTSKPAGVYILQILNTQTRKEMIYRIIKQ